MDFTDEQSAQCSCPHDPAPYRGLPMGMYHCPECGAMVLAGMEHPSDEDVRATGMDAYKEQVAADERI